jgi:peptide-methionine (S)-S-oxide reductase
MAEPPAHTETGYPVIMSNLEIATLGGGCFWCLEAVYDEMEGVTSVESGYMGGHLANPDYRSVCTGASGHVEVVQVTFDPDLTSYREILEVFFAIHDPTSLNRQGNDSGPQYRSVIFFHSDAQHETAAKLMAQLDGEGAWRNPIVTELRPATTFYVAEDYHQEYFRNNPQQPYCTFVVTPKLKKFREKFAAKVARKAAKS